VLYVLDEPSIGLHQRDNDRLLTTLRNLRDQGNSVLVVEHDEEAIRTADWVLDIGPGAGVHGGRVVSEGTPDAIAADPASLTGQYLSGARAIALPAERRTGNGKALRVVKATGNNLRGVTVDFPLGKFVCVTGVSGGGKSTLTVETLFKTASMRLNGARQTPAPCETVQGLQHLDKVIDIDQRPIGRTPRSNPATYTGAFGPIRDWFAGLPEAKARGYKPGRFSFNVKGGRCEACQGDGVLKIEMNFLPDVYVTCETCKGARYNRETLEVLFKGKSIADVLDMTVEEAQGFFAAVPSIREKMDALMRVGLGYIKVGQQATTLSGGEAQRVKLSKELSRRSTGRTLYILDEPTTGLHFEDVKKLLEVLHELVEQGNTVVVIEHNLDVIKTADWIIDIGPRAAMAVARSSPRARPRTWRRSPPAIPGTTWRRFCGGRGRRRNSAGRPARKRMAGVWQAYGRSARRGNRPARIRARSRASADQRRRAIRAVALLGSGTTRPAEMTSFAASSTLMSSGMTSDSGTKSRKPEVGFGVVGRKTATCFSCSPMRLATSPRVSVEMKAIAQMPRRGYSTRQARLKLVLDCAKTVSAICLNPW
jgi:ABC-type Mn2+/Zn2+ transport system ATPase subunit